MKLRWKLVLLNLIDAVLLNTAVLAALALRFDGQLDAGLEYVKTAIPIAPFYTFGVLLLVNLTGVNQSLWRYAGIPTFLKITRSLFIAFSLFFFLNLIPHPQPFPKSVVILSWLVATILILVSRIAWKILRTPMQRARSGSRRLLIAGAGDVGAALAVELRRRQNDSVPVGFVDDDPAKLGRRIEDLPVLGTTIDIPRLIEERRVVEVVIAAPSAPARLVRQIVSYCQEAGVACRTVPSLADFAVGKGTLGQVRDVQIEDLLGRDPVSIDFEGISERIRGRTVLVTGAAGSIGSELCRQLARFVPEKLIALDHAENPLTYLGLELAEQHPELSVIYAVGDVKDEFGVDENFRVHRPDFVFHAAAHKHVNLLERAPREAILNNIMGTRNVARAAVAHGVKNFVLVSTDKAVNPTNVMGASKRACEMVLQALEGTARSSTIFSAVRFGNVLGSEGSVLPIFRRQLASGGPLTVTHPDARRYFMTIPEASQLVIQAALLGESNNVFVLDMGEQVRIIDVAEQLIRLSGLRPGIDIPIRFVGLRPGEKLEEELLTASEKTRVTKHAKIFSWELDPVSPSEVERQVDELIRMAHHSTPEELRTGLGMLVREYRQVEVAQLPVVPDATQLKPAPIRDVTPPIRRRESKLKRFLDVTISAGMLACLAIPTLITFSLYRLSGTGRVRFVREERLGRNRRSDDRRAGRGDGMRIDRRGNDRRQRELPGPIFVCYRIEFTGARRSPMQKTLLSWARRWRLDRVLYLWNVLRGQMSLVGPSSRLVQEPAFSESWATAYIHSRRPGLIGPGAIFTGGEETGDRLAELYDGYYSKFGGMALDLETLLRSLPRLLRGEETVER